MSTQTAVPWTQTESKTLILVRVVHRNSGSIDACGIKNIDFSWSCAQKQCFHWRIRNSKHWFSLEQSTQTAFPWTHMDSKTLILDGTVQKNNVSMDAYGIQNIDFSYGCPHKQGFASTHTEAKALILVGAVHRNRGCIDANGSQNIDFSLGCPHK